MVTTAAAADGHIISQLREARGTPPRVLAFDLSLTATGVAYPDGMLATIKPPVRGSDYARIAWLCDNVLSLIGDTPHDLVVLEELVHNPRNTNSAVIAMIHGSLRVTLHNSSDFTTYTTVPPASLKKYATGKGNAPKPTMRVELYKRTGRDIADDNQVDAAWLRLMALDAYGHAEVELPQINRDALTKVAWPDLAPLIDITPIGGDRSFIGGRP